MCGASDYKSVIWLELCDTMALWCYDYLYWLAGQTLSSVKLQWAFVWDEEVCTKQEVLSWLAFCHQVCRPSWRQHGSRLTSTRLSLRVWNRNWSSSTRWAYTHACSYVHACTHAQLYAFCLSLFLSHVCSARLSLSFPHSLTPSPCLLTTESKWF